jgi:flagellar hook assembly protein FlgD
VAGQQVRKMDLGHQLAGNYVESNRAIYWDGKTETGEAVSSGTYFYQL